MSDGKRDGRQAGSCLTRQAVPVKGGHAASTHFHRPPGDNA